MKIKNMMILGAVVLSFGWGSVVHAEGPNDGGYDRYKSVCGDNESCYLHELNGERYLVKTQNGIPIAFLAIYDGGSWSDAQSTWVREGDAGFDRLLDMYHSKQSSGVPVLPKKQ